VDNYSFIRETFGKEINEIMDDRSKNENIPVLTEKQEQKWFSFETDEDRNKFVESLRCKSK
jgi:ribosomal protein L11